MKKIFLNNLNNIFRVIWNTFIKPKLTNEDAKRQEFILNVILGVFLIFLFFLTVIYIFNAWDYTLKYKVLSIIFLTLIWITFISLLYLSRQGYIKSSSYGLIILITIFSTSGAIEWGFDLPQVIISYLLIIVISSILFNIQIGVINTVILSFFIFFIGYYQVHIQMPNLYWRQENPEMIDTISFSLEFFFIMTISWLSNYEMKKSIKRLRYSEQRLIIELDRISKVYHFAEFGKLSSGVFHDLMNPLTSIYINMKEIENSLHPKMEETKQSIEVAVKASRRMENLLLVIEKQIKPTGKTERFLLNQEIMQAVEMVAFKAKKAGCEIFFKNNEDIYLIGTALSFYQTITNLLSNAIDSYDNLQKKYKPIKIFLSKNSVEILILIEDNGRGIENSIKTKIFNPFFTTKDYKGLGLGLSVSKEKIEKEFGGTISVESKVNEGTTFTITIPIKEPIT